MTDWATPFGILIALITVMGTWASLKIRIHGAGHSMRTVGTIQKVDCNSTVTRITVQSCIARKIRPGQFVFLYARQESPHPFSVAAVNGDSFTVAIKALGDFTKDVVPTLHVGEEVSIEGPWGSFTPIYESTAQT